MVWDVNMSYRVIYTSLLTDTKDVLLIIYHHFYYLTYALRSRVFELVPNSSLLRPQGLKTTFNYPYN